MTDRTGYVLLTKVILFLVFAALGFRAMIEALPGSPSWAWIVASAANIAVACGIARFVVPSR